MTNPQFAKTTPISKPIETEERSQRFPKSVRILRSSDYRRVYDTGIRFSTPFFAAFCLAQSERPGPRVGFTCPRAIGKAVVRNRVKRRVREAVRRQLWRLGPEWEIVFNPRRAAADAPFEALLREVERLFTRCRA